MHWRELVGEAEPGPVCGGTNDVRRHGHYHIKFPADRSDELPADLQLIVEHLAYRIYACFRVKVPESSLVHDGARFGLASISITGTPLGTYLVSQQRGLEDVSQLPDAGDVYAGFFVDVLLANWDVVGLIGDNLIIAKDGIYRIDPGGALTYRDPGGRKGTAFTAVPGELRTMKDSKVGNSGMVFSRMSMHDEAQAAGLFQAVAWPTIQAAIDRTHAEASADVRELERRDRQRFAELIDHEFAEIRTKLASRHEAILRSLA